MDAHQPGDHDLYRICVGEAKAGYYLPHFERFDAPGASRVSWNWPAFFISFFWLLYRRMYGYAFAYFLLLPLALFIYGVVMILLFDERIGTLLYTAVAIAVPWIVMPMFANSLYHGHVRNRIAKVSADAPSHEAAKQRLLGQGATTNAGVIIGVACIGGVAIIGILAAIAVPAYQDYVIRSQVSEGLILAGPTRAMVADAYAQSGQWPDPESLDVEGARYVESVQVGDGVISIRYGKGAHPSIAGSTLSLHATGSPTGEVTWDCGYASPASRAGTDVSPKHLPSECRAPK
jgi:Tfp pilus assembly protein PilE